jgi:ergothioneine biosynthesis protein EgtB
MRSAQGEKVDGEPAQAVGVLAQHIRRAGRRELAAALCASRADTLDSFARTQAALQRAGRSVPCLPTLNLPLWELGHIGWFQQHWVARNPPQERERGPRADPLAPVRHSPNPQADALYDSSHVPHASRWQLPLPGADSTRDTLARQLDTTLELLATADDSDGSDSSDDSDDRLYFFRLVLLHEDMHHEAALYMAQALGLDLHPDAPDGHTVLPASRLPAPPAPLHVPAATLSCGHSGPGFFFDNEAGAHEQVLAAYDIDAQVLRWAEYLPFVEAGGLDEPRWWTPEGWRWRHTPTQAQTPTHAALPTVLRRGREGWQRRHGSRWLALDPAEPACHLSFHEAQAWCAWAGRRLPTEFEWEHAATSQPGHFRWGQVWEWTASAFAPYPGFVAHPYREYSAPWFDGRPVLRGASVATQPRLRHSRYRNYFTPGRTDIVAGLRSCALAPSRA